MAHGAGAGAWARLQGSIWPNQRALVQLQGKRAAGPASCRTAITLLNWDPKRSGTHLLLGGSGWCCHPPGNWAWGLGRSRECTVANALLLADTGIQHDDRWHAAGGSSVCGLREGLRCSDNCITIVGLKVRLRPLDVPVYRIPRLKCVVLGVFTQAV